MQEVNGFNVARINGATAMICRCLHMCSRRNKLPHSTWYAVTASRLNLLCAIRAVRSNHMAFKARKVMTPLCVCVCVLLSDYLFGNVLKIHPYRGKARLVPREFRVTFQGANFQEQLPVKICSHSATWDVTHWVMPLVINTIATIMDIF